MSKAVKSLSTLRKALVLFGLSGTAIAAFVPYLFAGSESPDVAVFFVVGSAIMLLTAVLFGYIDRLGMGFGKTTIVLATGYNALIAAVKLWLAPAALYELGEISTELGEISTGSLYLFPYLGVAILLLYLLVFKVMYQVFKRRLQRQYGESSALREALSDVFTVICTISLGYVLLITGLNYLPIFVASIGFAIVLALVLAAILAAITFNQAYKRAEELGQATLLANFFWLGCILIALYHAMWMIFLLTLFSIWPLRTYTPK